MFAGLRSTIVVAPPAADGTGTAEVRAQRRRRGHAARRTRCATLTDGAARYLYVPGHRPDRFAKALASGADAVILDLEDAVPVAAKDDARRDVAGVPRRARPGPVEAWVRINDGDRGRADLAGARRRRPPSPASSCPRRPPDVARRPPRRRARRRPDPARRERRRHHRRPPRSPRADGVRTLAIGEVDLAADLGLGDDVPRRRAVGAADAGRRGLRGRRARRPARPGRSADIDDLDRLRGDRAPSSATPGSAPCRPSTPRRSPSSTTSSRRPPTSVAAAERLLEAAAPPTAASSSTTPAA